MLTVKTCNDRDASDENCDSLPKVYPVVLGAPETSVFDSDSSSSEGLSEELVLSNQTLSPGSTVHIENSNDIVIGPLTQFHGPVTIYQNINSEKAIEDKVQTSNGKPADLNKTTKANAFETKPTIPHRTFSEVLSKTTTKRLFVYSVIILIALVLIMSAIFLSLKLFSNTNLDIKNDNVSSPTIISHEIYDKERWGGRQSSNFIKPLVHPVKYVVIIHTAGRFCHTFSECASIIQQIQFMHVSDKNPDIKYNFMIGGDASIYVGRGWDVVNFQRNNTIAVSFIGNYIYDTLSSDMVSALEDLLAVGVDLKKLSRDYKIVCHNQTSSTLSPGRNVYEKISKMPHFYGGSI